MRQSPSVFVFIFKKNCAKKPAWLWENPNRFGQLACYFSMPNRKEVGGVRHPTIRGHEVMTAHPPLAGEGKYISVILHKSLSHKALRHYTISIGIVKGQTLGNLHKSLYSRYLGLACFSCYFAGWHDICSGFFS